MKEKLKATTTQLKVAKWIAVIIVSTIAILSGFTLEAILITLMLLRYEQKYHTEGWNSNTENSNCSCGK
jgi:hypothetical protein